MNAEIQKLTTQAKVLSAKLHTVREQLRTVIVGQEQTIQHLLLALAAEGHVLLEGVPGLAKTLMVKALSESIKCSYVRIQFTPDLLPADIIGTKIYNHKDASFQTITGPIFANVVLADEINRAPPKVQSALLEAMQERQISIQGETHKLQLPFIVLATQNPIESEGTYKLPEAQVDRFLFKLLLGYPTRDEEEEIIRRYTGAVKHTLKAVVSGKDVLQLQKFTKTIYADEQIERYVARIIDATRHPEQYKVDHKHHIEFGASPRASIGLVLAGKAHALLQSRGYVTPDDIQKVAHAVLRHRILLTYEAEAADITSDMIIDEILENVAIP